MRTNVMNVMKPLAVVVLGLAGAFANGNVGKGTGRLAPVQGYKHIVATIPCESVQMCDNEPGFLCKSNVDSSQLYRLNTAGSDCPNQLFRSTEF